MSPHFPYLLSSLYRTVSQTCQIHRIRWRVGEIHFMVGLLAEPAFRIGLPSWHDKQKAPDRGRTPPSWGCHSLDFSPSRTTDNLLGSDGLIRRSFEGVRERRNCWQSPRSLKSLPPASPRAGAAAGSRNIALGVVSQ